MAKSTDSSFVRGLKQDAKALLKDLRNGDEEASGRFMAIHVVREAINPVSPSDLVARAKLKHAQLVLAKEQGLESWEALIKSKPSQGSESLLMQIDLEFTEYDALAQMPHPHLCFDWVQQRVFVESREPGEGKGELETAYELPDGVDALKLKGLLEAAGAFDVAKVIMKGLEVGTDSPRFSIRAAQAFGDLRSVVSAVLDEDTLLDEEALLDVVSAVQYLDGNLAEITAQVDGEDVLVACWLEHLGAITARTTDGELNEMKRRTLTWAEEDGVAVTGLMEHLGALKRRCRKIDDPEILADDRYGVLIIGVPKEGQPKVVLTSRVHFLEHAHSQPLTLYRGFNEGEIASYYGGFDKVPEAAQAIIKAHGKCFSVMFPGRPPSFYGPEDEDLPTELSWACMMLFGHPDTWRVYALPSDFIDYHVSIVLARQDYEKSGPAKKKDEILEMVREKQRYTA